MSSESPVKGMSRRNLPRPDDDCEPVKGHTSQSHRRFYRPVKSELMEKPPFKVDSKLSNTIAWEKRITGRDSDTSSAQSSLKRVASASDCSERKSYRGSIGSYSSSEGSSKSDG